MENSKQFRPAGRIKLTRKAVNMALANHEKGSKIRLWDRDLSHLYLLVTPAGSGSYCLRYEKPGGVKGDFTIGSAKIITPEDARAKGVELLANLKLQGVDPVQRRRLDREVAAKKRLAKFDNLVEAFWLGHDHYALATARQRRSLVSRHLLPTLGKRPVEDISSSELQRLLKAIQARIAEEQAKLGREHSGHRQANMCHEVLKSIFNWANRQGLCSNNPAKFEPLFDDKPRKRFYALNEARFKVIWDDLSERENEKIVAPMSCAIKLCMITLQRPNEVAKANIKDFDWVSNTWLPAPSRTKTKAPYFVPLSEMAKLLFKRLFEISGSEWALPMQTTGLARTDSSSISAAFNNNVSRLYAEGLLDTSDIELYDMRRYGRTLIKKRLKFSKEIAEMVINHKQADDLSTLYDLAEYHDDIREAMLAWSDEIHRIVR